MQTSRKDPPHRHPAANSMLEQLGALKLPVMRAATYVGPARGLTFSSQPMQKQRQQNPATRKHTKFIQIPDRPKHLEHAIRTRAVCSSHG